MAEIKKIDVGLIIKSVLVFLISGIIAVLLFAVGMYFLEGGYNYSPLFATVSVAVGCFMSSLYLGIKFRKNGILIGIAVGGVVFIVITIISLLVNSSAVGVHTLLRLVILLLSSLIGGVFGVNRNTNPKYI